MERKERKNSKGTKIVLIIVIVLLISLIPLNIITLNLLNTQQKKYNNTTQEIKEKNLSIEELNAKNNELKKEIDHLTNIETEFANLKTEYFKNIKQLEDNIKSGKSNAKIAYITFDDGPYYLTLNVLKVLEKYNVNATFFNIGLGKEHCYDNSSYDCTTIYKKIVDSDHTMANHTYSHLINYGLYNSTNSFINQVKQQEKLIKTKTGYTTNIVRFPGGSSTAGNLKSSIINKLKEMNYGWVDWTAQDGDGKTLKSTTEAMNNLKNTINEKIEVVLLHDYNTITYKILPNIIEYLQEKGYILLPLFYDSNMVNK